MFCLLSFQPSFQNSACTLYLEPPFQALKSHMWPVVTVLGAQIRAQSREVSNCPLPSSALYSGHLCIPCGFQEKE